MKKIFLLFFILILSVGCSFGENEIEYDSNSKTVSVITENYHLKNILVEEYIDGKINKDVSSSIDFDRPVKSANLLDLEGHGQLYGKPMPEFLENKNLIYIIVIEHDDPASQEMPVDLISFSSAQIKPGRQIFDSGNMP